MCTVQSLFVIVFSVMLRVTVYTSCKSGEKAGGARNLEGWDGRS